MSGRFLSAPFFICALQLAALEARRIQIAFSIFALLAIFFSPRSVLLHLNDTSCRIEDEWRIADQRIRYAPWTSPRAYLKAGKRNTHELFLQGIEAKESTAAVVRSKAIGMQGLIFPPTQIILDPYALADPLLARLPMSHPDSWRIGHFDRALPEGYLTSLETLNNEIADPALKQYYEKLIIITRGDLFNWERLSTIIAFNLGRYEHLRLEYMSRMQRLLPTGKRKRPPLPKLAESGLECSLL